MSSRGVRASPTRHLRSGASGCRALTLAAILIVVGPALLEAQTIRGVLGDGAIGGPIEAGIVSLLREDGASLGQVETDSLGAFTIRVPGPGSYYLRAERTGYATKTDGVLAFDSPHGEMTIEFYLRPDPVELQGLDVEVEPLSEIADPVIRRRLRNSGFIDRQRFGLGSFRTPADMERLSFMSPREIFWGIPRLRVLPGAGVGGQSLRLQCTMGPGGQRSQFGGFVNGIEVFRGTQWDLTADVAVIDIAAIEAYTGVAQMPLEFAKPGLCGVILIWTK